jgi:hypothetical protein
MDEHVGPTQYMIRVRGVLGDRLLTAFPGLRSRTDRGDTVLAGALPDQAALHGVLTQIEALGLELVEVRRSRRGHAASREVAGRRGSAERTESLGSDDARSSGRAGRSIRSSRTIAT